jgi:hypothetical protein
MAAKGQTVDLRASLTLSGVAAPFRLFAVDCLLFAQ